jgi:hypothetical protein
MTVAGMQKEETNSNDDVQEPEMWLRPDSMGSMAERCGENRRREGQALTPARQGRGLAAIAPSGVGD